jgi:flavin reductase (DIM6/NTAB) family NADH-FMN oxidoreductase RutF
MEFDMGQLSPTGAYAMLIQAVVPRPVAWILSVNDDGSFNLAPFSFFNGISGSPPLVAVGVETRDGVTPKDTARNITARGVYTIHIAHRALASVLVATSRELPYGVSELAQAGLATVEFSGFAVPRLRAARVALGCELVQRVELPGAIHRLLIGRVARMHVDDDMLGHDAKGRPYIDVRKLDPLARLGREEYAALGEVFALPRPR